MLPAGSGRPSGGPGCSPGAGAAASTWELLVTRMLSQLSLFCPVQLDRAQVRCLVRYLPISRKIASWYVRLRRVVARVLPARLPPPPVKETLRVAVCPARLRTPPNKETLRRRSINYQLNPEEA